MAKERVSIINGKSPILLIAPHGAPVDDINTDIITEKLAGITQASAVINRGWERANDVDYWKDMADCNNFSHMIDVVRDEFFNPILKYKARNIKTHNFTYIFLIHGVGNDIRNRIGDHNIDMIIGYGAGNPASYSCDLWRKNLLIHLLIESQFYIWEGKPGGAFSGWAKNNMNQLFRKQIFDPKVQSMQLEIVKDLRSDREMAEITADYLGYCINNLLKYTNWTPPTNWSLKTC